tara:strand:+ start:78 stop:731 length:654 start_codon:yes stop_codon:yes gene_type:complete
MNKFYFYIIVLTLLACSQDVNFENELGISGCIDEIACNYNPEATTDNGDCIYPENYPNNNLNCDGDCIIDYDGDGNCDEGDFYELSIQPTGDFALIIIKDSIAVLDIGDQIGVFDSNGVIESCFPDTIPPCYTPEYGEVLGGAATWDGTQMEISIILSVDLSSFNGPILNGALKANQISIRVWKYQENQEYETELTFEQGDGSFNSILTVVSDILLK